MYYTKSDILTPANAITLLGLLLTVFGAFSLDTVAGLGLVFVGRVLDLVDGPVARRTRTTKFSVFMDPVADKLALLAMLIAIIHYDLAPLAIILFIFLENVVISLLSTRAHLQKKAVGAVVPGKLNIFFQQSALIWFVLAAVLQNGFSPIFEVLGYAAFITSLPLGLMAVLAYRRQTKPAHKATTT